MKTLESRRCSPRRSMRARFAPVVVFALLLCLTPLPGQQPASADHDSASASRQGPVLASSEIQQGAMLLHFTADRGLLLKSSGRGAFEIAGADHIWFPAEAHLVNGIVVVSTSLVQQPTAVRYTWSGLASAALFNSAGVPAAPFRTDLRPAEPLGKEPK